MNRAGFLKHFAGELLSSSAQLLPVVVPGLAPALRAIKETPPQAAPADPHSPWVLIGSLADFPPDSRTPVNQGQHLIIARPRGLYALDAAAAETADTPPRRPLRLECNGQLALNPGGQWPANACLSLLTGNRISEEET